MIAFAPFMFEWTSYIYILLLHAVYVRPMSYFAADKLQDHSIIKLIENKHVSLFFALKKSWFMEGT